MNVQATKLQLMQLILESKNKDLLNTLLNILQSSSSSDNIRPAKIKLTPEEKEAVLEGLEDFANGRYVDFETVLKEFK